MNEAARKQRTQQRLTECFPKFAQRVKAVIDDLEARGFQPLIQDADRSLVKIEFDSTQIEATGLSTDQAKGELKRSGSTHEQIGTLRNPHIGAGGMGAAYQARDMELGRDVTTAPTVSDSPLSPLFY